MEAFLNQSTGVSQLARQVVMLLTATDAAELVEEGFAMAWTIEHLEIKDLSRDQEKRGFRIAGNHYWDRHPQASSDVILPLRIDLAAGQRGFSTSRLEQVWPFGLACPDQAIDPARNALGGQW